MTIEEPLPTARQSPLTRALATSTTARMRLPVIFYFAMIALPIHFHIGPLFMTGLRFLLLVMIVPLFIKLAMGKFGRILIPDILFLLHLFWAFAAMQANSPEQAVQFIGSVDVDFYGGYLLARAYIRSSDDFIAMCRLLFLLVIFTLPFAIYESQSGRAPIPELIKQLPALGSVTDFFNATAGRRLGLERAQVIFAHPIHYGLFCSTAFSMAIVGFKGIFGTPARYLVAALVGLGVFFSLSSGALLSTFLQLGLILWALAFSFLKARWFVLIGFLLAAYVVVDLYSNRTPLMVFLSYATFSPGTAFWRALIFEWGWQNVLDNPVLGLGLNDWVRPWWMHTRSVDNFWLVIAMQYGIPGLILLAIGYLLPIWRVSRRNFEQDSVVWRLRRAWMFTLTGLTFTLCTVDIWATMYSYVFFLFGAGMWFITVDTQAPPQPGDRPETHSNRTRAAFTGSSRPSGVSYTRFPPTEQPRRDAPHLLIAGAAPKGRRNRETS